MTLQTKHTKNTYFKNSAIVIIAKLIDEIEQQWDQISVKENFDLLSIAQRWNVNKYIECQFLQTDVIAARIEHCDKSEKKNFVLKNCCTAHF